MKQQNTHNHRIPPDRMNAAIFHPEKAATSSVAAPHVILSFVGPAPSLIKHEETVSHGPRHSPLLSSIQVVLSKPQNQN